jgi:SAM-dependent methyltransferase
MSKSSPPPGEGHAVYDQAYTRYQVQRSALRRRIRKLYILQAARLSRGPTLDFGCGIGELLRALPEGSLGVEYNEATVQYCQQQGLDVRWYNGFDDDWTLSSVDWKGRVRTLFLSHVLEHFDQPAEILRKLLQATEPDITRAVIVVPGRAGFKMDPTHRTYVDLDVIRKAMGDQGHWRLIHTSYFPFNLRWVGNVFAYNELHVVLERSSRT